MEASDIHEEWDRMRQTTHLLFSNRASVTAEQWRELETHNYLYLIIWNKTEEDDLAAFISELLSRRQKSSLEAVRLWFYPEYYDVERNERLIACIKVVSPISRVYLQ